MLGCGRFNYILECRLAQNTIAYEKNAFLESSLCSKSSFYLLHVYLLTCSLSKRRKWRQFKSAQWSQSSSSVLLAFYIFYSCRKMDQDFNWKLINTVCKREKPFLQGWVAFLKRLALTWGFSSTTVDKFLCSPSWPQDASTMCVGSLGKMSVQTLHMPAFTFMHRIATFVVCVTVRNSSQNFSSFFSHWCYKCCIPLGKRVVESGLQCLKPSDVP